MFASALNMKHSDDLSGIPDVRDGLTEKERVVLTCLQELQSSRGGGSVPTPMLYGRVVEFVDMSVPELQAILQRWTQGADPLKGGQ